MIKEKGRIMNKKLKKHLVKGVVLTLASSMILAGCASGSDNKIDKGDSTLSEAPYEVDATKPAWQVDSREDNKLTWYVNADWFNTQYGNDVVTKKFKEDLNVDIEFSSGDDAKLNTYFAGGEMPDIITLFGGNSSTALKADTWAIPLKELADKYDPYFYEVANEQTLSWYELKDGKTYGYPSYSNSQDDYDSGYLLGQDAFVIRNDIYEAIGKPNMKTPEEFLAALGMIKEKYPDVTPFGFRSFGTNGDVGSIGGVLQNHLGVPIITENGEFYDRNLDEEYLEWIKVFNEAYRLGYISQDNFADNNTIFEEKISKGQYGTMMISGAAQLGSALGKNIADDPARQYIAIDGPDSEKYDGPTINQSGLSGWTVTYISKDCKNPSKAIQIFTYLLSEHGQYLTVFGIEDETYTFNENGKAVFTPEVEKMRNENPDQFKKEYRMGEFWFFGHDRFAAEKGEDQTSQAIKQIKQWTAGKLKPQFILENIDPDNGTAEARNLMNINTTWATTLASAIQASSEVEFDKIIEDYRQFLVQNKFEDIVKIRNEKIKENAEKLGITEFK